MRGGQRVWIACIFAIQKEAQRKRRMFYPNTELSHRLGEHLPSKCEALSSNPSNYQEKKKKSHVF
jgi:hypothetical protein